MLLRIFFSINGSENIIWNAGRIFYIPDQFIWNVTVWFNITGYVDASHAIFEVEVPKEWIGKTVGKLDIRKKYDINIMAVKDDGKVSMAISADTCFKEDVTLLVLGEYKAIKKCFCI